MALKAIVGTAHISYKMVNTATGEILLANDVSTREIKPGFGLKTKDVDLENMSEFDQTVIGIAIRKAVNQISEDIVRHAGTIEWAGKVVQSRADTLVYFTPGRGSGVKLDNLFDIYAKVSFAEEGQEFTEEFMSPDYPKARVVITGFIGDKVARAKVIQGSNIKIGDVVKLVKQSAGNKLE